MVYVLCVLKILRCFRGMLLEIFCVLTRISQVNHVRIDWYSMLSWIEMVVDGACAFTCVFQVCLLNVMHLCMCVCVYVCVCVCVCLCVPMHACTPLTTCMNPMSFVSYCLFEWFFTAEFLFNCVIVEYAVYSMYSSMRFCLICLCFVCTCLYCLSCSCCNCSWTGKKLNDIHCESGSCCLRGPHTGVKILICSVDVAELSSSLYPCYDVRSGNDGRFCRRCGRAVLFCTPMLWC